MEKPWRNRRWVLASAVLAALAVAGVLLNTLGEGDRTLEAVGFVLMGLAGVLAVAGAFYLVGLSEDRDRARRSGGGRPPS